MGILSDSIDDEETASSEAGIACTTRIAEENGWKLVFDANLLNVGRLAINSWLSGSHLQTAERVKEKVTQKKEDHDTKRMRIEAKNKGVNRPSQTRTLVSVHLKTDCGLDLTHFKASGTVVSDPVNPSPRMKRRLEVNTTCRILMQTLRTGNTDDVKLTSGSSDEETFAGKHLIEDEALLLLTSNSRFSTTAEKKDRAEGWGLRACRGFALSGHIVRDARGITQWMGDRGNW
ncbi:hypothetical protein OG21DRAFT_1525964 [Imleria badia]|nr:hypothetical protein OG21DRAFT_1525964 [Imleria badia]